MMRDTLKRWLCALRGHGNINWIGSHKREGWCKRCGAYVDLWPRQWGDP